MERRGTAAVVLLAVAALAAAEAQLSPAFYDAICPALQPTVRRGMAQAVQKEPRMGASILRLFFHDCFANSSDGSILLDDTPSFTGEKSAGPNANSVRGYEIIDGIKAQVDASCNATVSCADLGGPNWTVQLGRRDALTASPNVNLPSPLSSLPALLSSFRAKGLDARDLTTLSGAHTVGFARCSSFRAHVYNDTAVDSTFAAQLRAGVCPWTGGDGNLAPLELQGPNKFDNKFFRDLIARRVLLRSDQELFGGGAASSSTTDGIVRAYAANASLFADDFAAAMVKLGNLALTGSNGEIRLNCRRAN
ncbi:peroxidase P7 isoform X1 [Aegilops tauschii subsp. strangulata]|uniref:Peroxidase n=1 Tax=Aegilops tauschii subsp. strangulata TaxID=200361 RepID=A0A453ANP6_AEGTS